ncbi:hypothetical protein RJT34_14669 [Clitoria ternatea]|uniref:Uncharacterized protein n=1 Tax=Clitoria ternatea TaxID=43366 RepID=A0AAN9PLA5_CLITE
MADLRKIGLEGFALIDKFYGPPRRSSTATEGRRERNWVVYHVPNHLMEDPSVNTKDAGISLANYPKPKPQNQFQTSNLRAYKELLCPANEDGDYRMTLDTLDPTPNWATYDLDVEYRCTIT